MTRPRRPLTLHQYLTRQPAGAAARMAVDLDVSPSLISMWASGRRPVPAAWCFRIEHWSNGYIRAETLRPDLEFRRTRRRTLASS